MTLHFKVNPYYLLAHSLERTWSNKPFPEWARLVKKMQVTSQFLFKNSARAFIEINDEKELNQAFQATQKIFFTILKAPEFKKLLQEAERYRAWVENEWRKKGEFTLHILKDITGLTFPHFTLTVLITHPELSNGSNIPEEKIICWGHSEDWKNYTIVYLCHEILHILTHKKFINEEVMHAIIELATDNELRIQINQKGQYFKEGRYEVGHVRLRNLEKRMLPLWKKYLRGNLKAKSIVSFEKLVTERKPIEN